MTISNRSCKAVASVRNQLVPKNENISHCRNKIATIAILAELKAYFNLVSFFSSKIQQGVSPALYHPGLTSVSMRNRRSMTVSVVERRTTSNSDLGWGPFFRAVALACKLSRWGGFKLPPLTSCITESTPNGAEMLKRATWETPFIRITAEGAYGAKGDDQSIKINGLSLASKIDLYAIQLDSVLAGAGIAPLSFAIEAQRATHEALLGLTTPSTKETNNVEGSTQQ